MRHSYDDDTRYGKGIKCYFLEDRNHGFTYNDKKWFVIDWESGLARFSKILELYPIAEQSGRDVFITFGFKILTPGDKETFFFLKELSLLNEIKDKEYGCQVSLDYLAEVLDTTTSCQSRRLKKLKKAGLVKIERRGNRQLKATVYIPIRWALPDSTLLSKLIILIRRKRLLDLVYEYDDFRNTQERQQEILNDIKRLLKKIPKYTHILSDSVKKALGTL